MSDAKVGALLENQDWSDESGRRWLSHIDQFEGMIARVGADAIDAGRFTPGERVVDVGCGGGPTTLEIARRVAPNGVALGVDLSSVLVEAARARAQKEGLSNARFVNADAATADLDEAPFDVLFSRFGVMFFADPAAAFAHMRGWLKPGARMVFACWAPLGDNPWVTEVQAVIARHIEVASPDPLAPGPFALADRERTRDILAKAGFAEVTIEAWRGEQPLGGPGATPASATEFLVNGAHVGMVLADEPEEVKAKVIADLEAMLATRAGPEGIMFPCAAWIVTARTPS